MDHFTPFGYLWAPGAECFYPASEPFGAEVGFGCIWGLRFEVGSGLYNMGRSEF